jgi:hypothetical protein
MDQLHALPCSTCHKGNAQVADKDLAHEGLIPDPGDLDHVDQTCGKCHPEHAHNVKISRMALVPKLINHTRYAFGAQDTAEPVFGVRGLSGLKEIPVPKLENLFPGDPAKTPTQDIHPATDMKPVFGDLGMISCEDPVCGVICIQKVPHVQESTGVRDARRVMCHIQTPTQKGPMPMSFQNH